MDHTETWGLQNGQISEASKQSLGDCSYPSIQPTTWPKVAAASSGIEKQG